MILSNLPRELSIVVRALGVKSDFGKAFGFSAQSFLLDAMDICLFARFLLDVMILALMGWS